jgi:glycosyltransferase involved in cell wall biosynthesis
LSRVRLALSNHALRAGGGIERYALTLVRGLHERGQRPLVLAKSFDRALPEFGWVDAVTVPVGFVPSKLRDLWFDMRLRRLKRRLGFFPLIACNQTGAADIAICGSTHPGYLAAMGERERLSDRWKIALERAHLERSRVIVAHSRLMAEQVQRFYGIAPAKIRLLYPPVDGERFSSIDEDHRARLREKLGLPRDQAVFLLASTGHRRKGLDMLAEFFERSTLPACLVVAGRPLDRAASSRVRSLGYRRDIEDVYRAVDYTVIASRFEPFGLVGIESVLCGTPLVVADNAGCAEVVREPAALRFRIDDAQSFRTAVEQAVERWRAGTHRLHEPRSCLAYDPAVSTHVDALLELVEGLRPASA